MSVKKKKNRSRKAKQYNKTIIVTGGAGFIGSNYINIISKKYPSYFFIVVDCITDAGSLDNIKVLKEKNVALEKVDIRNVRELEIVFKKYHPTHIIHFAAESHVDTSITNPSLFVETNILGTNNLLTLAHSFKILRFHHISTDEVYGSLSKNDPPFTENSPILPNNPYSASKAGADMLMRAYSRTFGLEIVITRSSNNYGPNQDTTKLIPYFITSLLDNKKVPLYSKGQNIREWIFVEDHIDAIDLVFHKGNSGEIYNIPGYSEHTNKEITDLLLKYTNKSSKYIMYVQDRLGHDFRYALSGHKIWRELGWKPGTPLKKGIKKTFEYYMKKV